MEIGECSERTKLNSTSERRNLPEPGAGGAPASLEWVGRAHGRPGRVRAFRDNGGKTQRRPWRTQCTGASAETARQPKPQATSPGGSEKTDKEDRALPRRLRGRNEKGIKKEVKKDEEREVTPRPAEDAASQPADFTAHKGRSSCDKP